MASQVRQRVILLQTIRTLGLNAASLRSLFGWRGCTSGESLGDGAVDAMCVLAARATIRDGVRQLTKGALR